MNIVLRRFLLIVLVLGTAGVGAYYAMHGLNTTPECDLAVGQSLTPSAFFPIKSIYTGQEMQWSRSCPIPNGWDRTDQ